MVETILQSPFVVEILLPFLLVFTVVFAVLQKSEVLGKGKRQIDAIVSLVIGLSTVAFGKATGIIIALMPFLAVSLVVVVVFMILVGAFYKEGEFGVHKGIKIAGGIIAFIAVVVAVVYISGAWEFIQSLFEGGVSDLAANILFIALIVVAVVVVVVFGKAPSSEST